MSKRLKAIGIISELEGIKRVMKYLRNRLISIRIIRWKLWQARSFLERSKGVGWKRRGSASVCINSLAGPQNIKAMFNTIIII